MVRVEYTSELGNSLFTPQCVAFKPVLFCQVIANKLGKIGINRKGTWLWEVSVPNG
jgi:hypothetical protein